MVQNTIPYGTGDPNYSIFDYSVDLYGGIWNVRARVCSLTDTRVIIGINSAWSINISPPVTFTVPKGCSYIIAGNIKAFGRLYH